MRAMWSGAVSFGMVHVPCKLYSALESDADVKFCTVHRPCGTKLTQKRFCPACQAEVAYQEVGRGWPATDPTVMIEDAELEALRPRAARVIDIEGFITDIDIDFIEKPYRLGPEDAGTKAFQLLRQAMLATKTMGVGRFVMRSKAYPVLIRPDSSGLTLHLLRWVSELRPPVDAGDVEIPESELKMATRLVEALTIDSPVAGWRDEFAARVLELCEAKAGGGEVPEGAEVDDVAPAPDMLAALEASLAAAMDKRQAS